MGNKKYTVALLILISLLASSALAGEQQAQKSEVTYEIVELAAKVGYVDFPGERELESEAYAGASIGLNMTKNWLFSLDYARLHPEDSERDNDDIDVQFYAVDALYRFLPDRSWQPYVSVAFGQMDVDGQFRQGGRSVRDSDNFLRGGLGVQYRLSGNWALRADYTAMRSLDLSSTTQSLNFTAAYRFGAGGY